MLEKLNLNDGLSDIIFRDMAPQVTGRGYVYVRGGQVKFGKYGKPFAALVLVDIEGNCIPGYVFNLESILSSGRDLKAVIGRIVIIDYTENRFGDVGLTVIINKIELCAGESQEHYSKYIGSVSNAKELLAAVGAELSSALNRKVALGQEAATATTIDYSAGKVGGLAEHYFGMMNILKALRSVYTEAEYQKLMGMFFQFILVHCSFVLRDESLTNAELSWNISNKIHQYTEVLATPSSGAKGVELGDGVLTIVNYVFHGVESDDLFVRAVCRAHQTFKQTMEERVTYGSLGISQSGNAGYGKIVRYSE